MVPLLSFMGCGGRISLELGGMVLKGCDKFGVAAIKVKQG